MGRGDLFLGVELYGSGSEAMVAGRYSLGGSRPIGETQVKKQREKLPGEESVSHPQHNSSLSVFHG